MSIQVSEDSMPAQLDAIRSRLAQGETRMQEIEGSMKQIEWAVAENTSLTRVIGAKLDTHYSMLEDLNQGRIAKKWIRRVIIGLGGLAAAATAIGVAIVGAMHWLNGKP